MKGPEDEQNQVTELIKKNFLRLCLSAVMMRQFLFADPQKITRLNHSSGLTLDGWIAFAAVLFVFVN